MELTAEQQTQAAQLSNGLPWIYPGPSNADFWSNYFSNSGPSLTADEQASGISAGPQSVGGWAPSSPTPTGGNQPSVTQPPVVQPTTPQPFAGAYESQLIKSLRQASQGELDLPGVTMLENRKGSSKPINFSLPATTGLANNPPVLSLKSTPPVTPPSGGAGDGGGGGPGGNPGGGGGITIGPGPSVPDPVDPEVPDYTDDLWPPVDEPVAEPFPVPDSGSVEGVDLPPLDPVAEPFPVPDRDSIYIEELPPLPDEQPDPPPEPSVELIQDLPLSTEPAPPSDPEEDFQIDREAGLVPEWDIYVPPPAPKTPPETPPETPPDIPEDNFDDLDFSEADLLDMLFGDFSGGGGGGLGGGMNMIVQE